MGSTLSLFSQLISNPRSQTANEELEKLYKLMKAMECKECKENRNAEQLQELMEHWYKLEKNTRRQTAQQMMEHFYKLAKAEENRSQKTLREALKEWKSKNELDESKSELDDWDWEHWYKEIAVSECNEKLLLFAMKCGWLAVNSTTEEIMKRKRDLWKCTCSAFSCYRCLKKLDKKYGDKDIPIDNFKEPSFDF